MNVYTHNGVDWVGGGGGQVSGPQDPGDPAPPTQAPTGSSLTDMSLSQRRAYFASRLSGGDTNTVRRYINASGLMIGCNSSGYNAAASKFLGLNGDSSKLMNSFIGNCWRGHSEPNRGDYRFDANLGGFVNMLTARNALGRVHGLLYNRVQPSWFTSLNPNNAAHAQIIVDSTKAYVEALARWIKDNADGRIIMADLCNEEVGFGPGPVFPNKWVNTPLQVAFATVYGYARAFIDKLYQWAYDANPNVLWGYLDFHHGNLHRKSDWIYGHIRDSVNQGTPIGFVGMQHHVEEDGGDDAERRANSESDQRANILRYAALGISTLVAEFDVDTDRNDIGQRNFNASLARRYVRLMAENIGLCQVHGWEATDRPFDTWLITTPAQSTQNPPLYQAVFADQNGNMKIPTYDAIAAELGQPNWSSL